MTEWGQPQNFTWLWSVPAVLAAFVLASWRRRGRMRAFGEPALVAKLFTNLSPGLRLAKRAFLLTAVTLIVVALAQPHFAKRETVVERRGTDVLIAIDVSNSMLAKDVAPSRLEKAKLELSGVVDRLKGDRIGVVAFAGEAFIQCPLTLDRGAVKLFLSTVNPNLVSVQGTSISRAIDTAVQAFPGEQAEGKALVLLTDGEDHEGAALEAADRAGKKGVRIFTIGIGTPEGRTIPDESGTGFKRDSAGRPVVSKLNESLLKEIAGKTKGKYYRSSRGDLEADDLAREIKRLTQKGMGKDVSIEYEENYRLFLLPSFLLLLLEAFLSERKSERRKKPGGKTPPAPQVAALAVAIALAWPLLTGFKFVSETENDRGNRYYSKGQVGRAKSAYLSARKADPKSPEIAFNLGNAYYKEESLKESTEAYEKAAAAATGPLRARAFYNLGNSLARQERVEAAIEAYKESLRSDPRDKDAKHNLEILIRRREEEEKNPPPDPKENPKDQPNPQQKKENQESQGKGEQSEQNQQNQQDKQNQQDQQNQQDKQNQQKQQDQQDQQNQKNEGQQENQQNQGSKDQRSPQGQAGQEEKESEKEKSEGTEGQGETGGEKSDGAEPKKEKGEAGEQGEEKKDSKDEQKKQGEQREKGESGEQDAPGEEGKSGEKKEEGEGKEPGEAPKDPGGQEPREESGDTPVGASAGEREEGPAEAPKSAAQVQAEQLLEALEGQERQVLKMSSGGDRRRIQRRVNERDW